MTTSEGNSHGEPSSSALSMLEGMSDGQRRRIVAARVDGELRDLVDAPADSPGLELVTIGDPDGLDVLRHTIAAQVLGRALVNLYPGAKLGVGPTTDDGFYYDVLTSEPVSSDDLERIEAEMRRIIAEGSAIEKRRVPRADAESLFAERDQEFKLEIIADAPDDDAFNIYEQGDTEFVDLCRGPHLRSLSQIDPDSFALIRVAGAYWRGDSDRPMLTRVYGTAWRNAKELRTYLKRLEEAKRRDHRSTAQKLSLFHFSPDCPGQVFWLPNGWTMYTELQEFIRETLAKYRYNEINTPRIVSRAMYERSGHWEKFGTDDMFITEAYKGEFALKPMNCPSHVEVFKSSPRSYRALPLRFAEFGNCYRREQSGALHGLMRVASMTQDDAHIFCTMDQVEDEIVALNSMIEETYSTLGFDDYFVRFSDRPPKRIGDDATWDRAEAALLAACDAAGVKTVPNPGEGAFYGPKLEYVLTDAIGRQWQCGTIQLDFNLPTRLDATYTATEGSKERPVMIHRAILGTLERFLGIFLEQFADGLPLWIAPVQIAFLPVTEEHVDAAVELADRFRAAGIRAIGDVDTDGSVGGRVKGHVINRVPLIGVIGDREVETGTVMVRRLGVKEQESASSQVVLDSLLEEIGRREPSPSTVLRPIGA